MRLKCKKKKYSGNDFVSIVVVIIVDEYNNKIDIKNVVFG